MAPTRRKHYVRRALLYLAVLAIVIWTVAPYLWLIISSVSYRIDLLQVPLRWIPSRITLDNYRELFVSDGGANQNAGLFLLALRNSAIIAFSVTSLALLLGVFSAYALSRLRFPGSGAAVGLMMTVQMLPPIAIIIPMYVLLRRFHLLDTHPGLIIVYLSFILPLVVWLMRSYFASIPGELEDMEARLVLVPLRIDHELAVRREIGRFDLARSGQIDGSDQRDRNGLGLAVLARQSLVSRDSGDDDDDR